MAAESSPPLLLQLRFRSSAAEPARVEEPPAASKQPAPGAAEAKAPGAATTPLNFNDPQAAFQVCAGQLECCFCLLSASTQATSKPSSKSC